VQFQLAHYIITLAHIIIIIIIIIIIVVVVIIIIIIIIILVITFMQDIYNYIPETNHVSSVHSVAAVLVTICDVKHKHIY